MSFWILTAAIAAACIITILLVLWRGQRGTESAAASDLKVYRDQLAEVDRDVARGVLNADEAERARNEVKRRILEADRALAREGKAGHGRGPATLAAVGALVTVGGAYAIYLDLGAPGYYDLPLQTRIAASEELRANRPSQAEAEKTMAPAPLPAEPPSEYTDLVEQLRSVVAERPDDLRGHELLTQHEAALGNYANAWRAQERVVELKGDEATAADYSALADLMILATNGYVSPEAETALAETLSRDPLDGPARFYSGLFFTQIDRPDRAFQIWRRLLETSPPDAPWVPLIQGEMQSLAAAAGVRYTPPPPAMRGPTAEDMAAAQDMAPEDRMAMVRGMVEGLSARLADEGGPPEDWARLITSLAVLGEAERARAIYDEALGVFAASEDALATIRAAGQQAGFAQ